MSFVTDAVGLTDVKGAKKASKRADRALKEASRLAQESIDFQKSQYEDWKNVYGDVEKNLSNYYSNLSVESLTAMGLQNVQQEFQKAYKDIQETYARRGLTGSNVENYTLAQARLKNAENRAAIRVQAPAQVAQEKASFLNLGLGRRDNIAANVGNAYAAATGVQTSGYTGYLGRSNALATQSMDTLGTIVGAGAGQYAGGKK